VERVLVAEKVQGARFTRVGTARNRDHLQTLLPGGASAAIHVVPFGVDLERVPPRPASPEGSPVLRLLNVGRLVWQKGQDTLLDACALLQEAGLGFHLTIVGEGEERAALEERRRRLGLEQAVSMPGAWSAERVFAAYAEADLFALSSVSEGFGLVLVEAMASGLPVVAPALPGMDEIVTDGVDGRLVPARSARDLADAVLELARDPEKRRRFAQEGAAKARARYDNRTVVSRFSGLLAGAAG
jgi:glycosyltransferase involved in cell wall biosynthesis